MTGIGTTATTVMTRTTIPVVSTATKGFVAKASLLFVHIIVDGILEYVPMMLLRTATGNSAGWYAGINSTGASFLLQIRTPHPPRNNKISFLLHRISYGSDMNSVAAGDQFGCACPTTVHSLRLEHPSMMRMGRIPVMFGSTNSMM